MGYHCCKETGISCDDLFDCTSGLDNWQRGWSLLKKQYCCKSAGTGCVMKKFDAETEEPIVDDRQPALSYMLPAGILAGVAVAGLGLMVSRVWTNSRQVRNSQTFEPDLISE